MIFLEKNSEKEKEEAKINALASDLDTMKNYVGRQDVNFKETISFIREANNPGLWKDSFELIKNKAIIFISGKSPEEKLEEAANIKLKFFFKMVLEEEDVKNFLSTSFKIKVNQSVLEKEKAAILSS